MVTNCNCTPALVLWGRLRRTIFGF